MSTPIKMLSFDQIYDLCNELGQPRYRVDQLISWLFVKQANNYDEMSNLPKAFRAALAEGYPRACSPDRSPGFFRWHAKVLL